MHVCSPLGKGTSQSLLHKDTTNSLWTLKKKSSLLWDPNPSLSSPSRTLSCDHPERLAQFTVRRKLLCRFSLTCPLINNGTDEMTVVKKYRQIHEGSGATGIYWLEIKPLLKCIVKESNHILSANNFILYLIAKSANNQRSFSHTITKASHCLSWFRSPLILLQFPQYQQSGHSVLHVLRALWFVEWCHPLLQPPPLFHGCSESTRLLSHLDLEQFQWLEKTPWLPVRVFQVPFTYCISVNLLGGDGCRLLSNDHRESRTLL